MHSRRPDFTVDTFAVKPEIAQPGASFASNGATPFEFSFGRDDVAIVSDATGGPGTSLTLTAA